MEMNVELRVPEHVIITADDNGITFNRKGLSSALNRGHVGADKVPYYAVSAVNYKDPGLTRGNFGVSTNGDDNQHGGYASFDAISSGSAYSQKYMVVFGRKHKDEILKLKAFVEEKVKEAHQPKETTQSSAADEIAKFKKLADNGVITQEEFEAKKKQLLGL